MKCPTAAKASINPPTAGGSPGTGTPEPRSSHELPLEQVLALAATLRDAPPAGTFVGIGGTCFDVGTPLTAPVAAALPAFADAIAAEIAAFAVREPQSC